MSGAIKALIVVYAFSVFLLDNRAEEVDQATASDFPCRCTLSTAFSGPLDCPRLGTERADSEERRFLGRAAGGLRLRWDEMAVEGV